MNKVILIGRLTADPELRQTPQGTAVARFTIAVDRRFKREGGPQADFISCTAWRQTADFICRYFHKGKMIAVEGSIQTRSWEDNDGKKRYSTEVIALNVEFCGDKQNPSDTGYQAVPNYNVPQSTNYSQPPVQEQFKPELNEGFEDIDGEGNEDDLPF